MNQKHDLKSKLKQRKIERDTSMFFLLLSIVQVCKSLKKIVHAYLLLPRLNI